MKKYSVSPPIPIDSLPVVLEQCESQGWQYVSTVGVGMAQKSQQGIALAVPSGPQLIPMVCLLVSMEWDDRAGVTPAVRPPNPKIVL